MQRKFRTDLASYSGKYENVSLRREDGILEVRLHTAGQSLLWGANVHEELGHCFADIAADPENGVVIITGTGDAFCGGVGPGMLGKLTAGQQIELQQEGRRLLENLLALPVPVIGAINGPALLHAELGLLANVVLAADHTVFQDKHFEYGIVPGDGVNTVWPTLLGATRGSYFLLMGQTIDASEAQRLGIINEILPTDDLMPRAWEIARFFMARPASVRRFSRQVLSREMTRQMQDQLSHSLALECLAFLDGEDEYGASLLAG